MDLEFIMRVMRVTSFDMCDSLWWRTDEEYAPITFMVSCSDTFDYACADCETLTPENIGVFEQSLRDLEVIDRYLRFYAPELFAARVRQRRPLPAWLKGKDERVVALFNAAGPERT